MWVVGAPVQQDALHIAAFQLEGPWLHRLLPYIWCLTADKYFRFSVLDGDATESPSAMFMGLLCYAGGRHAQQPVAWSRSCGRWHRLHQCVRGLGGEDWTLPAPPPAPGSPGVRPGTTDYPGYD